LRCWRITRARYVATCLSGEGARIYGGRWNAPGVAIVYCAESIALAALEVLVHTDPSLVPDDLVTVPVEVPDVATTRAIDPRKLPDGWRTHPAPDTTRTVGEAWAKRRDTLLLRVPSAIVPQEHNVLLNVAHPLMPRVRQGAAEPFAFDPRLLSARKK
jgi:RES domain-containing protein